MRLRSLATLIVLVVCARPAWGWCNKEHMQFARIAAERLLARDDTSPEFKEWLKLGLGNKPLTMAEEKEWFMTQRIGLIVKGDRPLEYWATMPDMMALTDPESKKVDPFGVHERVLHYIDLEFFMPSEADRTYKHDLSHKPKAEDIPHDLKDSRWQRAGMLPFRLQDCYDRLNGAVANRKLSDQPGVYPRDEHAMKWAGYLAHYAADNTQPQHATFDYKSSAYFADKRKAPNVHAEVEYRMCDDDLDDYMDLRQEFWPLFEKYLADFKDPVEERDVFKATVQVSLASYEALPMIGTAAMAATKQGGTPEKPEGPAGAFDTRVFFHSKGVYQGREMTVLEMKAIQTAWAVKRIERLWGVAFVEGWDSLK